MRASIRWLLACVLAVLVIYKLGWDRSDLSGLSSPLLFGLDETPRFQSITASNHSELQTEEGLSFWVTLAPILEETRPLIPKLPPTGPSTGIEALINHFANLPVGYERHQDLLRIPDRDVGQMQDAHTAYVQRTADLAAKLPFKKGTKGIVTTAVGPFLPILVVTLRMLRRTGSKLPVEVFVESWESYEKAACEEILPTLNARCLVLSDVLATTPNDIEPSKYQVKAFALLMSSFEDILLLDADSIPMEKPDGMLSSEPFSSTGLVTWPDYWASTISPLYYKMSSQPQPPLMLRATSESGQLLISKSKHAADILLSVYYNLYGPSHYYALLSQGAVGQGDKETYLAAAGALNASFWAVQTPPAGISFQSVDKEGTRKSSGTIQFNAEDDHKAHKPEAPSSDFPSDSLQPRSPKSRKKTKQTPASSSPDKQPRIAFIHAQTYKLDPATFVTTWREEIQTRMWGPQADMEARFNGRDVEREVWTELLFVACNYEGKFRSWGEDKIKAKVKIKISGGQSRICRDVKKAFGELFS